MMGLGAMHATDFDEGIATFHCVNDGILVIGAVVISGCVARYR